ncbi:MAG: hypothetical protein WD595_06940 [Waddliaceae bacterium]
MKIGNNNISPSDFILSVKIDNLSKSEMKTTKVMIHNLLSSDLRVNKELFGKIKKISDMQVKRQPTIFERIAKFFGFKTRYYVSKELKEEADLFINSNSL